MPLVSLGLSISTVMDSFVLTWKDELLAVFFFVRSIPAASICSSDCRDLSHF